MDELETTSVPTDANGRKVLTRLVITRIVIPVAVGILANLAVDGLVKKFAKK